jgi:nucleoside-diphosphate-sugar epimerase
MRVFVAGASGAIGRPLVRRLIEAGHEVTGMTRHEERVAEIRDAGADAAVCDVFDSAALSAAVGAARPEVVVHELTSLPPRIDPRRAETYRETNRLRTEGTANLIAAARAAGARRFVAQSIAFVYAPVGPRVVDEGAPVIEVPPAIWARRSGRSSTASARSWRSAGWSCATAPSTGRGRRSRATGRWPRTSAGAASRSSAPGRA